jgi:cytochrome c556
MSIRMTVVALSVGLMLGAAYGQFAKTDDAIRYRQSVMFLVGQHFGILGAMVKGEQPYDQGVFAKHAEVVKMLSTLPWGAFMMPGSDKGDTRLLDSAFSRPDEFQKAADQFQAEVAKLSTVAGSGDLNAVKAQFGETAKSCKACHGNFRK